MDNIDKNAWKQEIINRLELAGVPKDKLPDNPSAAVSLLARVLLAEVPKELLSLFSDKASAGKSSWPTGALIFRKSDVEFIGGISEKPDKKPANMTGLPPTLRIKHKVHGELDLIFNDSVALNRFLDGVTTMMMSKMFPDEGKQTE